MNTWPIEMALIAIACAIGIITLPLIYLEKIPLITGFVFTILPVFIAKFIYNVFGQKSEESPEGEDK